MPDRRAPASGQRGAIAGFNHRYIARPTRVAGSGWEYELDTWRDRLLIKSNHEREDFALYWALLNSPSQWEALHHPGRGLLSDFAVLDHHLIVLESVDFQDILRWCPMPIDRELGWHVLEMDEPIGDLSLVGAIESHQRWQRLSFSSPRHPAEIWQLDLDSGEKHLLQRQVIPCGHRPDDYVVERIWIDAEDGARVPLTALRHRDTKGPAPVVLYGYGAYGLSLEPVSVAIA